MPPAYHLSSQHQQPTSSPDDPRDLQQHLFEFLGRKLIKQGVQSSHRLRGRSGQWGRPNQHQHHRLGLRRLAQLHSLRVGHALWHSISAFAQRKSHPSLYFLFSDAGTYIYLIKSRSSTTSSASSSRSRTSRRPTPSRAGSVLRENITSTTIGHGCVASSHAICDELETELFLLLLDSRRSPRFHVRMMMMTVLAVFLVRFVSPLCCIIAFSPLPAFTMPFPVAPSSSRSPKNKNEYSCTFQNYISLFLLARIQ